ncbi:MAG: DUF1549 domain-containing protein [Bryobacteraceae bacterium]
MAYRTYLWELRLLVALTAAGGIAGGAAKETKGALRNRDTAKIVSLRLIPEDRTLRGAGASQRFVALAKYSDGFERDVTAGGKLSVSDERIAGVAGDHRVTARADGETPVQFQMEGRSAQARVRVEQADKPRPFSFSREVGGILTRKGCNSSDCHGGVKGQGGFKLSVNGTQPKEDYKWIVEGGVFQVLSAESAGAKTPRVNVKEPEKSPLLLKPAMITPHGGGRRFTATSPDYEVLLRWVRQGAPYGEESKQEAARIERLEVLPKNTVLDATGKQQLLVTAHSSDGTSEDVTGEALYSAGNSEVATVTPEGLATAVKPGETAVVIRVAGQAVSTQIGVASKPIANYPVTPARNYIDEHVFAKLRKLNMVPSAMSSDAEFLRRVCLDLAGTLPPPQRAREFLASKDPRKRDKLIDALLDSPEFVDYWTFRLSELFRYRQRATQLMKDTQLYGEWIRNSIAHNKPFDQMARERIAAEGFTGPSRYYYELRFLSAPPEIISEQMRVFMGRRLECARCHNHPYESWSQDQFWGMAAFYGRMTDLRTTVMDDSVVVDAPELANAVSHPRTKQVVQPTFLDGRLLPKERQPDPRRALAEWITSHPYFAQTIVNRSWDWFFGRGFVEPVDDFRSTNPPSHPELMEALAQDLRDHHYDLKYLMKLIVSSRTYQLSSTPNETNRGDRTNFSHANPKALDAAVLLDAVVSVTQVEEAFKSGAMAPPKGARAIELCPDLFSSKFLEAYGQNDRATLPEAKPEPSLAQALHLMTGPAYSDRLGKDGGRADRLARSKLSNRELIEELYLAAFSRYPDREEAAALDKTLREGPSRLQAISDLIWALISSREFAYRH